MDITLQVGVKILVQDNEGRYLLLERSLTKYPDIKGRWDIVGGRINPGTELLENLKREVKEETNLELAGEPKLVAAQDILRVPGKHIVRLTYVGKAVGDIIVDKSENDSFKWFTRDELESLDDTDMYLKELFNKKLV